MHSLTLFITALLSLLPMAASAATPIRCQESYSQGVLSWEEPWSLYAFSDELAAEWRAFPGAKDLTITTMDRWFDDKRVLVVRGYYNRGRCRIHAALVRGGERLVHGAKVVGVVYMTESPPAPTPMLDLFWIDARRMAQYGW